MDARLREALVPMLEKLQGMLGSAVEDTAVIEAQSIILEELEGQAEPDVIRGISEFLVLAVFTGTAGRYDTDRRIQETSQFGFEGLLDIFTAVTFQGTSSFDKATFRDNMEARVLGTVRTDVTVEAYFKEEKYFEDFATFTKLIEGAGGRYIKGLPAGRQVDLLCDILRQDEVYSSKVRAVAQEVISVYDEAFRAGFDLEPYHAVIGANRRTPAFNISRSDTLNMLMVSRATGGSAKPRRAKAPLYQALSEYIVKKFITDGKYFKTSLSRQWEVYDMLPTGKDGSGKQTCIYQPLKLAEYVYGRQSTVHINKALYRPYKGAAGWKAYCEEYVRPNVEQALYDAILVTLEKENLLMDTEIKQGEQYVDVKITENLGHVRDSMSIMFIMMEQEGTLADWASLKLRMCVPRQPEKDVEPADRFLAPLISKVIGKSTNAVEFTPIAKHTAGSLYLYDYEHTFDIELATGRPLFAFKALDALQKRGETVDVNNIILGRKENGSILTAKKDGGTGVDFSKNLIHYIIAGSRAGKGVMTLNILGGHLASARPIFYLDRKPDMSALMAAFAGLNNALPNMFVINGGQYGVSFDCFEPPGIMNMMSPERKERVFKNVPEYMLDNKAWDLEFGDLVYMRAIIFCLGLIQLRAWSKDNMPDVYQQLNGDEGITVIIDEFSNWQESFVNQYLNPRSGTSYTAQAITGRDMQELKKCTRTLKGLYAKKNAGEELKDKEWDALDTAEEQVETLMSERRAYYTDMMNNLKRTFSQLKTDGNALLRNSEVGTSDVFIIGQNLDAKSVPDGGTFYPSNQGTYKTAQSMEKVDPFATFFYNFSSDFIMGYNMDRRNYAHQGTLGSKANKFLTNHMRGFVYSSLGHSEVIGEGSRDNFDKTSTFFKPFLILNNGKEPGDGNFPDDPVELASLLKQPESAFVGQMIEKVGIEKWKEYRKPNLVQDENKLRPEVGFVEYMTQLAKTSKELDLAKNLSRSKEIADFVVSHMGYDGDIFDFLFDLRPAWTFASTDIVNAFKDPITYQKNERFAVYTELFGYGSLASQLAEAKVPAEEDSEGEALGGDLGDLASLHHAMDVDNSQFLDTFNQDQLEAANALMEDSEPDLGEDGYLGTEPMDAEAFAANAQDSVPVGLDALQQPGVSPYAQGIAPDGSSIAMGAIDDAFDPDVSLSDLDINNIDYYKEYVELCEKLTRDAIRSVGGATQVKVIEVQAGSIYVNNMRYAKKLPQETIAKLPVDKRRLASNGLYAEFFNFAYLMQLVNLTYVKIDALDFVVDKIASDLSIEGSITPIKLFDIIPTKGLVLDSIVYQRDQIGKEEGGSIFTSAEKRKELAASTENWLVGARTSSWNSTKTLFMRKGFMSKIGGIFSLGATLTTTGAIAGYRTTREITRGFKDMFRKRTVNTE